jgi:hypothetical protein
MLLLLLRVHACMVMFIRVLCTANLVHIGVGERVPRAAAAATRLASSWPRMKRAHSRAGGCGVMYITLAGAWPCHCPSPHGTANVTWAWSSCRLMRGDIAHRTLLLLLLLTVQRRGRCQVAPGGRHGISRPPWRWRGPQRPTQISNDVLRQGHVGWLLHSLDRCM